MNKYLIIILTGSFFTSCGILKPKELLQPHKLISIEAVDLSEDKSILSSQNDEVLVSILFGSRLAGQWYMNGYYLPLHTFDSMAMTYTPDSVELSTPDDCKGCEVWVCLAEMDEDNTEASTHQKLVDYINAVGYRALDSKSLVDDTIKDNDFLGYARIPYFSKKLPTTYTISGQDLLDKYAYKVTITTAPSIRE